METSPPYAAGVARRRVALRTGAVVPAVVLTLSMLTPLSANAAPTQADTFGQVVATDSGFAEVLESKYIDPDRVFSTDVRWWLGDAANTDESLLEEIQALYDGGFRGVELCMQNDSGANDAIYAYGSEMWAHKWDLMMNKLLDLGMSVYLTSGTHWATSNVPGLDPTSQQAMQNLTLGTSTVAASGKLNALPAPAANAQRAGASFVSAYAYRIVDGNTVDAESFIDLSDKVTPGDSVWAQNLDWTAPNDGSYRVFALWTQGTFQTSSPAAEPSYATNYFDDRGVEALQEYWNEHYLSDPALVEKIKQGDVQLFMDSPEFSTGSGFTWWAEDLAQEFEERKGYDVTPYLFLIDGVTAKELKFDVYAEVDKIGTYRLTGDDEIRQGIINDYQDVLTQLYRERMLQPLREWLNSVGIKTRAQISYGRPLEISEPIMDVDYPEAENLNQYNQVDLFRLWTGGAKLQNKVLSAETSAALAPYNATAQKLLQDAYREYAAGFQRVVWHVWGAGYGMGSYQWPGFVAGNYHYLGTRNPSASEYDELNAHLGRVQQLMQTGVSRTDVGFLHQKWTQGTNRGGLGSDNVNMNWQLAHQGVLYRSTELQDNGYTYDYFSPRFLFDDEVTFNDETKTIEQAGYKAVVLYQNWLDLDGAKRILDWSKRGLKVVILEDAASRTPYNDGKDAELRSVIDELKMQSTVRAAQVADMPATGYFSADPGGYDDNVLEKLQELGVEPYAGYSNPNEQLLAQTRADADGNQYLYVYNYDDGTYRDKSHREDVRNAPNPGTNIKTDVVLDGEFVPYEIDAWTGEVTELADFRWEDGNTVVPIDLDYNNVALLAFEKANETGLHIVSTDASTARATEEGVAVRVTQSGPVTTKLSDGAVFGETREVPAAYDITNWDLTVESWRPNDSAGDLTRTETVKGVTSTNRKTSTIKTPIDVQLDTLKTWNEIPEVGRAVSGTGHYEASFHWDASSASGAYLDFGDTVESTMKVWINGQKLGGDVSTNPTKVRKDVGGVGKATIDDGRGNQVPLVGKDLFTGGVSWMKPVADVSRYLKDGENTIVIDYSAALSNVQLDRGVITELFPYKGYRESGWWQNNQTYLNFGPRQAKIVPFQEMTYTGSKLDVAAAPRLLGKNVYLSVSAANIADVNADITIESEFGRKVFKNVQPGKSVAVSLNTRATSIGDGEATVTATTEVDGVAVMETKTAPYEAVSPGH